MVVLGESTKSKSKPIKELHIWSIPFTCTSSIGKGVSGSLFTYFFPFLRVNFSRENNFRSRMFVRCRVFFFPWITDV